MSTLLFAQAHSDGWIGRWSPQVGDPSIAGWTLVVLYLVAVIFCARVLRLHKYRLALREREVWLGLTVLLALLGINKQLDLQTALTELGKIMASEGGWYDAAGFVKLAFVAVLALVGLFVGIGVLRITRRHPRATRQATWGALILLAFVILRAALFHHVGHLLGPLDHVATYWAIEACGIVVVGLGAWQRRRSHAR